MCVGLGELRPNTILLGWPRESERAADFGSNLGTIDFMGRSILISRFAKSKSETDEDHSKSAERLWSPPQGTIDVWWREKQNGELMLLLAHLLTLNEGWKGRTIRLLRVIDNEAGRDEVESHLVKLAEKARIKAKCEVVVSEDFRGAIQSTSRDASIVFMGFAVPEKGLEEDFYQRIESLSGNLPRVMFVKSNGNMSLNS